MQVVFPASGLLGDDAKFLAWWERTTCVKGEASYRKRCITAQRYRLWGLLADRRAVNAPYPGLD